jgi:O-antigen polymerase
LNPTWLNHWSNQTKIVGSAVLIITILVGLYFLKKDSADGRLLIWQCSARMIANKPLLGHGVGGFQREFMLYQADFFRTHPASSYSMRADIVKHPFNEYLLLLVEHGLLGGLVFGLFVYMLIREYRKNKSSEMFYTMLCLSGIGVFACFSYPLVYPFIRLMVVFCAALIMQPETKRWKIPQKLFSIIKPAVLVVSVTLLIHTCNMFYDEYSWNTIAKRSLAGETKKVLPDYARLYKTMNRNGLFLYNYAAELNFIDRNTESNRLFFEASHFMNDIDLQLQMADNYQKMKQYKEAEDCLLLASNMIPNRFIPLYRLAKLYELTKQTYKAKLIAKEILFKPIKIISPEITMIKVEMEELLNK